MKGATMTDTDRHEEVKIAALPTWENMCRHVDKYGLDNESKGYSIGKPKKYTTYKTFRSDAAIEVARRSFGVKTYVAFVEKYGQIGWADEAAADHAALRAEEA